MVGWTGMDRREFSVQVRFRRKRSLRFRFENCSHTKKVRGKIGFSQFFLDVSFSYISGSCIIFSKSVCI